VAFCLHTIVDMVHTVGEKRRDKMLRVFLCTWRVQNVQSPLSMLTYKGDLNLCLKYVTSEQLNARRQAVSTGRPSTSTSTSSSDVRGGELLVLVKQARNLTAVRSNGFSDPFCKWSVVHYIITYRIRDEQWVIFIGIRAGERGRLQPPESGRDFFGNR